MNLFFKRSVPALSLLGLVLGGCQPEIDAPQASAGSADFSRYVAVGNSLTAGFSDGGLYREGQLSSYPNILAQQFRTVGGGNFEQPLFTEAQFNGSGYLGLTGIDANGSPITANVPAVVPSPTLAIRGTYTPPTGGAPRPLYTKFVNPINNLGVPGIRMENLQQAGYGSQAGNPYFERITPDANAGQTYVERLQSTVASINPTFFTFWLGNNDVLGFATAGGAASSLTPTATFTTNMNAALDALTARGAKGLVATIPDVTGVPFFTTVGPRFKATLTGAMVPAMVIMTGAAPGGPASGNRRVIQTSDIRDANGAGRQLFTLTSSPFLALFNRPTGAPWRYIYAQSGQPRAGFPLFLLAFGVDTTAAFGTTPLNPIPSAFVLDDAEQAQVTTSTTAFNTALTTAATTRNLALFDANAFFRGVAINGIATNGVANTASYISGNLFSLDGVHPTPRGYAVLANEMISAINRKYGSTLQGVNPNSYRGVKFPQ